MRDNLPSNQASSLLINTIQQQTQITQVKKYITERADMNYLKWLHNLKAGGEQGGLMILPKFGISIFK